MASDWNEYKIDDLKAPVKGSIAMGPFGSRIKAENFVTEGVPIIKGGQLHGAYVSDSGFDFLTPEKAEELKSSQAYRGDLVITHRGTIGQVSIIPHDSLYEKYIVSQSQLKVSFDKTKVNPYFVNYFFRSHLGQHRLLANASQVGVPAIAKASTSVKAIMIPCPSLEEQNKVVGYLKNLDDKIELNSQINETLEAMTQALFKSWFVDFDPVIDNVLAAGNVIPDELLERAEQRKSIEKKENSDIQDLFPDEFEFAEEMGWIPKGWTACRFKQIVEKYIDNRGKTPPLSESGIPLIEVKHIADNAIKPSLDTTKFVDRSTYESWFRSYLQTDDIIISTVGTIGRICIVSEGAEFAIAQNLLGFRFKREKALPSFMYYQMDSFRFRHDVDARLVTTVQASIKRKDLETIDLLLPSIEVQKAFEIAVMPFMNKQNSSQSIQLSKLRDILLPKLISGELRIADSVDLVEKV